MENKWLLLLKLQKSGRGLTLMVSHNRGPFQEAHISTDQQATVSVHSFFREWNNHLFLENAGPPGTISCIPCKPFYKNNLDIVCALLLVNKCVLIVLWSTEMTWAIPCLQIVSIYSFRNKTVHNEFCISSISKNYFIKEVTRVLCAPIACWKPQQSL